MKAPTLPTIAAGTVGGVVHLAAVHGLFSAAGYPPDTGITHIQAIGLVFVAALAIGILAHTRLVVSALGLAVLVVWVGHLELVAGSPMEYTSLGENLIFERDPYLQRYVGTWYVWVPFVLAGAVAELGIREGYGVATDALRNVPSLPFSNRQLAASVGGCALLISVCLYLALGYVGVQAWSHQVEGAIGGGIFVAVTLWGLLTRGLISPLLLSLLLVVLSTPDTLVRDGLGSSFSVLFFVAPAVVVVALVEWYLRYRRFPGDGTARFRFDAG